MKTTHPSPVSPIDEAEVAFLKGEPLKEAELLHRPWYVVTAEAVVGVGLMAIAWVAVVTLVLIFGDE